MSISVERQAEFAWVTGKLLKYGAEQGYRFRYGDAWRSTDLLKCPHCGNEHNYQDMLFFNGRSKKQYSLHSDRQAVDFIIDRLDGVPMTDSDWIKLGEFWEDHGGDDWGGRYGIEKAHYGSQVGWDRGHFGMR